MRRPSFPSISLFIFICVLSAPSILAIGITPSAIEADNLLRGSRFERSVQMSGLSSGQLVTVHATGEAASWITTDQGDSFLFPDRETLTLTLIAVVPPQVPNGRYEASVRFTSAPLTDEKGGGKTSMAVREGVLLKLSFEVTGDQVEEYTVSSIAILTTETGKPLILSYTLQNTGNVIAKPSAITIDVYDRFDTRHLNRLVATSGEGVASQETDRLNIPIDHDLPVGQYWGHVTIATSARTWQERVVFEVAPAGSLSTGLNLESLLVPAKAVSGGVVKIEATLVNTGKLAAEATLIVEISTDDTILAVLKSEPALIAPQETATIILYYTPLAPGYYQVEGSIAYIGKRTPTLKTAFTISSENHLTGLALADTKGQAAAGQSGQRGGLLNLSLILLSSACLLITAMTIIRRRRMARGPRP